LIESEIFGYEKGAFTDAKNRKSGLLEIADGGTVFLDEIGDMDVNLQSKLLKVIEDKEFRRLGSPRTTKIDVRIIAATNRDLQKSVKEGTFREDLYYRLSVVPIELPPLREHKSSIPPLAEHYLRVLGKEMNRSFKGFTASAMAAMMDYSWPGNVRELRNAIERSVILASGDQIDAQWLGLPDKKSKTSEISEPAAENHASAIGEIEPMSLAECEKRLITSVLKAAEGNKNKAAEILNIHRTTLYKKIEEYGIQV
jgi:DNA-binding NtrC family response regulator